MTKKQTSEAAIPETGRYYYGTGRSKTAVARVRLYNGSGTIVVNGKPYLDLFSRAPHQEKVRGPLTLAEMAESFNVQAKVTGGGISAWADALAHGTARG